MKEALLKITSNDLCHYFNLIFDIHTSGLAFEGAEGFSQMTVEDIHHETIGSTSESCNLLKKIPTFGSLFDSSLKGQGLTLNPF